MAAVLESAVSFLLSNLFYLRYFRSILLLKIGRIFGADLVFPLEVSQPEACMHKPKQRSNRSDDDNGEFDYDDKPKGRSGEGEDDDKGVASLEDDDDDPQPLDRLVKLKWRN